MNVNTYNFVENGCVFYHAIATSEEYAIQLAQEEGFNIEGMEVELERINICDELGRPYDCKIEDAIVR